MKVYIIEQCDVEGCSIKGVFASEAGAVSRKKELLAQERKELQESIKMAEEKNDERWLEISKDSLRELDNLEELPGGYSLFINEFEVLE